MDRTTFRFFYSKGYATLMDANDLEIFFRSFFMNCWTIYHFINGIRTFENSFKLTVKFLFKIKFSSVSNCLNDLMTSQGRWQGPTRVGRRQKTAIKCDRDRIEWVWPRDRVHPIAHPAWKNVWQQFAIKQNIEHTTSPFCCDDKVKCDKINVRVRWITKTTSLT